MEVDPNNIDLSEIDTVILSGGFGSRLRPVLKDKPKCLSLINGKPFIDIILDDCINQGLRRFVICVGYLKEQIIEYLSKRKDIEIIFSKEDKPLGTGGALKNAKPLITSDPFFVMNGDSYIDFQINSLIAVQQGYLSSILVSTHKDTNDFGNVEINEDKLLISFKEKSKQKKGGMINCGRYVFSQLIFKSFPNANSFSLEYDIFPALVKQSMLISKIVNSESLDIGTPDRLIKAEQFLK